MAVIEQEPATLPVVPEVKPWEILRRAADLLEEFGWCQRYPAMNAKGLPTTYDSPDVESLCMIGALWRSGTDLGIPNAKERRTTFYVNLVGKDYFWRWNDVPGRTKEEVVSLLRNRADALEQLAD